MIKHIPRKFLIHCIDVIDQETGDTYEVQRVLVQLKKGIVYSTKGGEEVVAISKVFVDLKNSVFDDVAIFKNNNVVVYGGRRYVIKGIEYDMEFDTHHLEISMV